MSAGDILLLSGVGLMGAAAAWFGVEVALDRARTGARDACVTLLSARALQGEQGSYEKAARHLRVLSVDQLKEHRR